VTVFDQKNQCSGSGAVYKFRIRPDPDLVRLSLQQENELQLNECRTSDRSADLPIMPW
jgi:hypothetical protein